MKATILRTVKSKFTEIRTVKFQMEDALAQPKYENNISKAMSPVDHRNSLTEERSDKSHDEQERSDKSLDEQERSDKSRDFDEIGNPGRQEEKSSGVV